MRISRVVPVAIAACALLGIAAFVLVVLAGRDVPGTATPAAPPPLSGSPASPQPFDDARATQISEAIASGDAGRVGAVIASGPRVTIDASAPAALKALAPIAFDVPTTRYLSDDTGFVQAYVGAARAPWVVYLLRQDGVWKLAATQEGTVS